MVFLAFSPRGRTSGPRATWTLPWCTRRARFVAFPRRWSPEQSLLPSSGRPTPAVGDRQATIAAEVLVADLRTGRVLPSLPFRSVHRTRHARYLIRVETGS